MRWRVRLFDGPILESPSGEQCRRFRSRKVGALLAYLALRLGHPCPREELIEAIWPDESDSHVVANRLRVTLASLRRQLEPSGVPFGTVLDVSMPGCVSLRSDAVWCDAAEAERLLATGQAAEAAALMQGTLLPGYYEDWALLERHRFDALIDKVGGDGITKAAAPASHAGRQIRSHETIPLYLTRFFGRETEKSELLGLLGSKRLVTVVGPGGFGKTRLAVETAVGIDRTAMFVSLAELLPGGDVPEAILRALHVAPALQGDLIEQVVSVLAQRDRPLLILDNAEHLIEQVAASVLHMLQRVTDLTILVTSQQRLDVPGERILSLKALETPLADLPQEELYGAPAVALFFDRARNARPDLGLTPRNAAAALEICALVEGMPLALELAGARVVVQTPAQIAETLRAGLIDLKSRQRGLSPRHRSLRASIGASFDLLRSEMREFVASLVVFQGGWTIEAAQSITGNEESEHFLEELTKRSLVVASEDPLTSAVRYSFLDSIRQFAAEQLDERRREALSLAHSEFFLGLASRVSEDDVASLRPLESDQRNLLAALEAGKDRTSIGYGEGLAGALIFAHVRGKHRAFMPYARLAEELAGAIHSIETRIRLRASAYFVLSFAGDFKAIRALGEAMLRDSGENAYPAGGVLAKIVLGYIESIDGSRRKALSLAKEALDEARGLGDPVLIWRSLRITAFMALALATRDVLTSAERESVLAEGEALSRECLQTLPATSIHRTFELLTVAYMLREQGRRDESYLVLKEAQATAVEHGMESMFLFCVREECRYAIDSGQYEHAAQVYGIYARILADTGYGHVSDQDVQDSYAADLESALGKDRFQALSSQGGRMRPADVVRLFASGSPPDL